MTSFDDLDRRLTARLDERAAPRAPDGLSTATTERIAGTAQRPAWATLERWIAMETRAQFGAVPRAVVVFSLLVLLTLAMATAIAIGASNPPKLPPPFGPAANGLIAFVSEGDIWTANADGTEPRPITSGPEDDFGPEWSRDGTRLAFWSRPDGEPAALVVVDAEGEHRVTIATSPDSGLRGSSQGGHDGDTYEWSADGAEIMYTIITPSADEDPCPVPSTRGGECGSRLFIAKTDGSGSRPVGDPGLDARSPVLSPDGRTVAFGGGAAGSEALYVMQWDGSGVRSIEGVSPSGGWAFLHQSWSPDGVLIATHSNDPQLVWIVDQDGSPARSLPDTPAGVRFPHFAPDGSAILMDNDSGMTLVPLAEEGSSVTTSVGFPEGWSPDGSQFLGRRFGPDSGPLMVFDRDGDVVVEIDAADGDGVSWQRLAE